MEVFGTKVESDILVLLGVSLTLCCFVVYSTRRFVVCLSVCHFVLVFFSPFSIAITSLGEERANLSAFRTLVRFVLVWICRFPRLLGVCEGQRFVIVALPGLFSYLFIDTKLKVYRSVVLPTLLYACETWTVYQRHAKRLNDFHTSCLRKLLNIKWQDRIPDTEVLKRAGMQSVRTLLKLAQLRWKSHVTRMHDERLPKKILYGELQVGKRSHGDEKKRYMVTLKVSLKNFHIQTESWEQIAQDQSM